MPIETVDDIVEEIMDGMLIYGACGEHCDKARAEGGKRGRCCESSALRARLDAAYHVEQTLNPLHGLPHYIGDEDHPLTTWSTYGGISRNDASVSDERLDQLAYDSMMCNISPEVLSCLRELVKLRRLKKHGGVGPHILSGKDGQEGLCGGPGVCKWCIREGR